MGSLLVVYSLYERALRGSVRDHLEAFRRYSDRGCYHVNLALRGAPRFLRRVPFDGVIFHTTFLSKRATPAYWDLMLERARPLSGLGRVRIALPQDEYLPPARLCDFIDEFAIDHVFSVAPPSEWPAIYPTVDRARVRISRVLTGYLEPASTYGRLGSADERELDIGYRAKELPMWLGRHALAKAELATTVEAAAKSRGLRCDISTRPEDTLLGDEWLRFLASCRYTIGAEGGASLLDRDGTLRTRVERYLAEHPGASFEEVEAECFPGEDGTFGLVALSPRHLEACATRTCQILVEGDYGGVLDADRHYIPLRPDLSNLDEVLDGLGDDDRRRRIVDAAYEDVVASNAYTYERFVREVEDTAVGPAAPASPGGRARLRHALWRAFEAGARLEVAARVRAGRVLAALRRAVGRS